MNTNRTTFALAASEPSPTLYDSIEALAKAAEAETLAVEALLGVRGSAAFEAAAETGVEEILCEHGHGNRVAATKAEFRVPGSPTRVRYLSVMLRLAELYVPEA